MNDYAPSMHYFRRQYANRFTAEADVIAAEERFDRALAAHDAEVRAGAVAEESEWDGTEYGYVDFEHGLIPLVHGYEEITHECPVRYGPWVPVKQEGAKT